jgi:hypothetical protein
VRDDIDYLNSLGFRLDCPSDFNELFQLLTMPQFIEAIGRASFDETIIAVDKFNRSFPDRPVWIL